MMFITDNKVFYDYLWFFMHLQNQLSLKNHIRYTILTNIQY